VKGRSRHGATAFAWLAEPKLTHSVASVSEGWIGVRLRASTSAAVRLRRTSRASARQPSRVSEFDELLAGEAGLAEARRRRAKAGRWNREGSPPSSASWTSARQTAQVVRSRLGEARRLSQHAVPRLDEARPKGERSLAECLGRFPHLADLCGLTPTSLLGAKNLDWVHRRSPAGGNVTGHQC
jgi:hypothetical protein